MGEDWFQPYQAKIGKISSEGQKLQVLLVGRQDSSPDIRTISDNAAHAIGDLYGRCQRPQCLWARFLAFAARTCFVVLPAGSRGFDSGSAADGWALNQRRQQ